MLEGENPFLIFCLNEYICILKKNRCRVWGAEGVINFRLQVTLLPPPATTQILLHAITFRLRPWRCAAVLIGCFSYLYQSLRENYCIHNGACYDI